MKKLAELLFIAIIAISCNTKKTDLEESNIKGKVWKIQETSFKGEEKFGKYQIGDKNYYGHSLYIFNERGNLIESQVLDRKGKPEDISKFTYNEDNLCIEITTLEDNELKRKQVNSFQGHKLIEVKLFDKKGEIVNTYRYDYKGDVISHGKILNKLGKTVNTFENDLSNEILNSQTVKDSINQVISITKYKRNKNNDLIETLANYPKDSTKYEYTFDYEYDKKNNWTKQYQFDKEGKIESIIVRNIIYYNDSKVKKDENDFIGMWFVVDDTDWFEFRKDKKYDYGYKDKITESGNWELDIKQQILTFRANDPNDSKKYKYEFEGTQIILFTIQGEEKFRLEKR